jgi:hypothetical protein
MGDNSWMWKNHPMASSFEWWCFKIMLIYIHSSTIIDNILGDCKSDPAFAVGYFYFDFNDPAKQHHENALRSLITQFSIQSPSSPVALEELFSQNQNGEQQPTTAALVSTLCHILGGFQQAYVILDALDECFKRDGLLDFLRDIVNWNLGNLHILVTSRKEQDIAECLMSLVSGEINIKGACVDPDIQIYIQDRLQNDPRLRRCPAELQKEIEQTLMKGACGMYSSLHLCALLLNTNICCKGFYGLLVSWTLYRSAWLLVP